MLKQRVITAVILAIFFLVALFKLPAYAWSILVVLMVMQGAWEWSRLAKMPASAGVVYLAAMLLIFTCVLWMYGCLNSHQKTLLQLAVYGVAAVFWLALVPAWFAGAVKTSKPWLMGIVGIVVLIPTGMAMLDLRAENPQPWWLLAVMGMVWIADISAYFAGRKFGKNKLAPTISPGKTWEGVAGAMLGVLVYVLLILQLGVLSHSYFLILLAIVGVALSVAGDLFESAIKRQAGVKDSGTLLPGHGGLLDRIDALTSTLPLAALVLILSRLA